MFQVLTKSELTTALASIESGVKPRGEGRRSEQTELWSIKRALGSLSEHNELTYPVEIQKRERPDFELRMAKETVGVEVSEIVDCQLAHTQTIKIDNSCFAILDRSLFRLGGKKYSRDELVEIASQTSLTGPGWNGLSVEIELAKGVRTWTERKIEKLNSDGFSRYPRNWLLLYNNLQLPHIHYDEVIPLIQENLKKFWGTGGFNQILLDTSDQLIIFTHSSVKILPIEKIDA